MGNQNFWRAGQAVIAAFAVAGKRQPAPLESLFENRQSKQMVRMRVRDIDRGQAARATNAAPDNAVLTKMELRFYIEPVLC